MQPPLVIVATYNDLDVFPHIMSGLLQDGLHVHVIDNWSSDGTYEAVTETASDWRGAASVERFPASGPVRHFESRGILGRKGDIAARHPDRWIINQDSDEIRCSPWPGVGFHAGLRRVEAEGFSAIDFACLHFRPVDDTYRAGMDPETHFRFFERGAPGVPHVKAWRQPAAKIDLVQSGGHEANFPGRKVYPEKFILKHYPIRNVEQGRRKIFAERLPRFHPDERAAGWHVHYGRFKPDDTLLWKPDDLLEWERDPAVAQREPWYRRALRKLSRDSSG